MVKFYGRSFLLALIYIRSIYIDVVLHNRMLLLLALFSPNNRYILKHGNTVLKILLIFHSIMPLANTVTRCNFFEDRWQLSSILHVID